MSEETAAKTITQDAPHDNQAVPETEISAMVETLPDTETSPESSPETSPLETEDEAEEEGAGGEDKSVKDELFYNLEEELEKLENLSEEEIEDLFNKNTASFRCLAQILVSRSSLLRHPLYHFPPLEDPGLDDAFNYIEPEPEYDDIGCEKYTDMCKEFGIVPINRILKFLPTEILNLKYYGLTVKQIKALTEALKNNAHVTELILQDNWLIPESVSYISELLSDNYKLKYLSLRECRIGIEGAKELSNGIEMAETLCELDLSFNSICDEGMEYLYNGLYENVTIRKLNLSHNNLGEEACRYLEMLLNENNIIEDINLSWNNLYSGPGMKMLCAGLKENKTVTSLNLSWNAISNTECARSLMRYLKASTMIEFLDLSNNRLLGTPLRTIRNGILNSTSLISVKLGNNIITPDDAIFLARVFLMKPDNPLKYMDLENVWVHKNFIPIWKKVTDLEKSINIAGIYSNYEIQGPDIRKLLFERARFLAMKAKKKKAQKDFGHFILKLPDEPVPKTDFLILVKKFKMKKVDADLINGIMKQFEMKKQRVDAVQLKECYMSYYPDTKLPEPKKKKGKKGRKGKKGKKGKVAQPPTEGTAAITTEGTTALPAEGTIAIPAEGTTASPVEGTAKTPAEGTLAPSTEGVESPAEGAAAAPTEELPTDGATAHSPEGLAESPADGATAPPAEGVVESSTEGATAPPVEDTTKSEVISPAGAATESPEIVQVENKITDEEGEILQTHDTKNTETHEEQPQTSDVAAAAATAANETKGKSEIPTEAQN